MNRCQEGWRVACLLVLMATLLACNQLGLSYTAIHDLTSNPERFGDRDVSIQGKVTNVVKLPFLETKLYSVKDETGEIVVITDHDPPLAGAIARVEGRLDTVATIGDQNVGLHLRETRRW